MLRRSGAYECNPAAAVVQARGRHRRTAVAAGRAFSVYRWDMCF